MKKIAFGLALLFLLPVLVAGAAMGDVHSSSAEPAALKDIPGTHARLYVQAASRYSFSWQLLAAVGKVECDHGRGDCYRPNRAGAMVITRWDFAFRHVRDERASSRAAEISATSEARAVRVLDS
ncbi:MAG: hypothetical protein ACRDF0_11970 [Candidatus Limnocylindria bacterium]